MTLDPILAADLAEEQSAAEALRSAKTQDELISTWWNSCDHFDGSARERLQETYAIKVREFAPMGLGG